jgi:hypothetical protein
MSWFLQRSERRIMKSREPQPIILPPARERYTTAQIEAASETTVIDARPVRGSVCIGCGHPLELGGRFCGHCGIRQPVKPVSA